MTCLGFGIRSFPHLIVGIACLSVGGLAAASADTGPSPAGERGPRLQITAPGKMARLTRPEQQIDRTTTASIPKISADQRVDRAFANSTQLEAPREVPNWATSAFVTRLTQPVPRLEGDAHSAPPRPASSKALDPALAFLTFPLGDEKAAPLERMGGGGYLASYVPEPLLQVEPDLPATTPTATQAPSEALTRPEEASKTATPETPQPLEARPEPSLAAPGPLEAAPKPPAAEAVPPDATPARSAEAEMPAVPAVRSAPEEPELPPLLLPTRPPLIPG